MLGQELPKDTIEVNPVKRIDISELFKVHFDSDLIDPTLSVEKKSNAISPSPVVFITDGQVIDFAPDYPDSVIIARLATVDSELPLRTNNRIRSFIDYFSIRNRDYTRKMMRRANIYFPIMEEILAKNNMPEAIKYLSIVESGLDPKIRSWAGAMGLWQFMPATGSIYKLDYDFYIDERLDPYKSTEAACKYLKQLYRMFGDWELALGAYNCGPGNMRKAIRRSGGKKTFEEVYKYLPKETRSYVPQFMAVNYVMRFTDEHNLFIEDWEEQALPEYKTITLNQYTDLNRIYEYSNVCLDDIIKLNPEIKRNAVGKEWKEYELKLPIEFFELGNDSIKIILDSAATEGKEELNYEYSNPYSRDLAGDKTVKITHRVRNGENLGRIANRYNVRVSEIKRWNRMRSSTIYPGQRLAIYAKGTKSKKKATDSKSNKKVTESTPIAKGEKVIHTVQPGDVVGSIAEKYEVSAAKLREWNGIKGNLIKVGQKLVVYSSKTDEQGIATTNNTKDIPKTIANTQNAKKYKVQSGDALYNIATKHGVSVTELKSFNGLTSNSINPGQELLIPSNNNVTNSKSITVSNDKVKKDIPKTIANTQNAKKYKVQSGDALYNIAINHGVSVTELKSLNGLTSNSIKSGQELLIPSSKKVVIKESEKKEEVISGNTKYHVVKEGDSLWSISKSYDGVTVDKLKELNNLTSNALKIGQKLKLG